MKNTNKVYEECIAREIRREKFWRNTRQGAFESSMLSLDTMIDSFDDPSKAAAFSDHGFGAYAIERYLDGEGGVYEFQRKLDKARKKILRTDKKLLEVFYLILKNGSNRKASIWELLENRKKHRIGSANATTETSRNSSKSSGSKRGDNARFTGHGKKI